MNTKVNVLNYTLKNPIIAASGTFGFGYEFADYYDINTLGSISLKGTTREPREGNIQPRIADCPMGLINSIGLQNPGVEKVISEQIPKLNKVFSDKVIANVGGHSFDDYIFTSSAFNAVDKVFAVELNISCPNVKDGGMAFGTDEKVVYELVKRVKEVCFKPLIVKLSPNVTDICALANAAENGGADALSLINTLVGMRINLNNFKPVIGVKKGGYSGPGIFPVALRMVYDVYETVKIPLIGMGGISTAEDVLEMMSAGASAVMVGSQNLIEPFACKNIVEDLPKVMKKYRIDDINTLIGRAH